MKSAQPGPDAAGPPRLADSPPQTEAAAIPEEAAPVLLASTAATEPVPLEVPLEEQITRLPPLAYPGTTNEDFERWAGEKRRGRLRLEVLGAALLLIAGVIATIVSARPAFILVAVFGIAALGAYEFLVTAFE